MTAGCPLCEGSDLSRLVSIPPVPVLCNQLCRDESQARIVPKAPIDLTLCRECGHVFNASHDASLVRYDERYENGLHHSAHFRVFAERLAADLHRRHALGGKAVVEVGCGRGDFLNRLCARGDVRGYGFDPGYDGPQRPRRGVRIVRDAYVDVEDAPQPDLLCCRHVLEHVERPVSFLEAIVGKLRAPEAVALYLEVPNALFTLRDAGIWDVIYEHPSYFTPASFTTLAARLGFRGVEVGESYAGQFLAMHARIRGAGSTPSVARESLTTLESLCARFRQTYVAKVGHWNRLLTALSDAGRTVAVWGAGSKGNTFLNLLPAGRCVSYVIDVHPGKQGRFVAGTGQRIVGPRHVREEPPDVVIVMNGVYFEEIRHELGELGANPAFLLA